MLFFLLSLISGTAPPAPFSPRARDFGSVVPLRHLVTAVQNAWFGFGRAGTDLAVLAACAVTASLPAVWLFSRNEPR